MERTTVRVGGATKSHSAKICQKDGKTVYFGRALNLFDEAVAKRGPPAMETERAAAR